MTNVRVKERDGRVVEVVFDGHSGYVSQGEDIVCAAISAIAQTAILGIREVAKVDCDYGRDELKGYLIIQLPDGLSETECRDCELIIRTMLEGVKDISKGYPKFIKMEVTK